MNSEISFREKDVLVMKLLHYFITEQGYNPIILRGVTDEIWLENMDAPYSSHLMLFFIANIILSYLAKRAVKQQKRRIRLD